MPSGKISSNAMKRQKTLYVSDLDGTLLGAHSELSEASARMLNQAISMGADFTIATARTPATVSRLLEKVNMKLPAIVMTGAVRWDFNTYDYSNPKFIDTSLAKELLTVYRCHNLPVFHYSLGENAVEVRHCGDINDLERKFADDRSGSDFKRFILDDDISLISLERTLLFYSMQPTAKVERLYHEISEIEGITPVFYHDIFGPDVALLEVFSDVASKASAVRSLASEIGAERVVVFGDNVNDIPMMQTATHAVAVENAIDQVRDMANEVIGCNTSDCVAKWILNDIVNTINR